LEKNAIPGEKSVEGILEIGSIGLTKTTCLSLNPTLISISTDKSMSL